MKIPTRQIQQGQQCAFQQEEHQMYHQLHSSIHSWIENRLKYFFQQIWSGC
jgi:hypothetical protein